MNAISKTMINVVSIKLDSNRGRTIQNRLHKMSIEETLSSFQEKVLKTFAKSELISKKKGHPYSVKDRWNPWMRKEDLDNITLPRHTENKRHKKMGEPLTRTTFCEWAKERGTSVLIKGEKLMMPQRIRSCGELSSRRSWRDAAHIRTTRTIKRRSKRTRIT